MAFDYFYGAQSQQFAFYRIPKVMFTDNRFQNISTREGPLRGLFIGQGISVNGKRWMMMRGRVSISFLP